MRKFEEQLSEGKPIIIRDEKTVSGRVHVGSMRGVAIHGVIAEALSKRDIPHTFLYEFNDFDPMDDIPSYLPREVFEQHLGKPLKDVPWPDDRAKSFAEYFANDFKSVILDSGFKPTFYWGSELYTSGRMDGVIREALVHSREIGAIYKKVSGGERNEKWLPIAVVCPSCGKIATTDATDFDGETVQVICREKKVDYTKGCGFEGRVSPFGGNAKLPWKPEWAAKWKVNGVMVEGAGKDHSTKGGSRDVANHISEEVFTYPVPFDVPYEFFLVGGKKMSSSKGMGSSSREIADLLPPKLFRLALLSKEINQAFNFDPEGDTIPVLYDLFDKLAEGYTQNKEDDYAKLFEYIHGAKRLTEAYLPRFSQVAFIVQMPHMDLRHEVMLMKGSELNVSDVAELNERAEYAMHWLKTCAPEKFVFNLQQEFPLAAKELSATQKKALAMLAAFIESSEDMPSGEEMHAKLHALKEEVPIAPAELFSAIYLSFLAKTSGPKAGWFLSVLEREFVLARLREASA